MIRKYASILVGLLLCVPASAATINTTLTVNATATLFPDVVITGTASFTGGIGNGDLKVSGISLASLTGPDAVGDVTITLAQGGTLTGKISVPVASLTSGGSSATASITFTGGTGTYAGATSGPTPIILTGSVTGDVLSGFKLNNFTGSGTITTGGTGGGGTPTPTISAVQDAASNTPGIAQGSIFIVKGSNLSASGYTPFSPPRPTQSSGVKVTFTPVGGGAGTDVYLVYLYNQGGVNQIAAILPSTVPVGTYNVTVTNGTASAPFVAQVVANKVGLFTQDSSGSGLASVQGYISQGVADLNRLTTGSISGVTYSPAKPGQAIIAYATGLGAYAAGDNDPSKAYTDFRSGLQISAVVGGVTIPVDYAGRAGYPGQDQINFTLPANIPTGCAVSLQISVNGKLSAPTSISIAPDANAKTCVLPGYTTTQLTNLDQGGTITTGGFSLTQFQINLASSGPVKSNTISGGFTKLTGFQLSSAALLNVSVIQQGSCQVIQSTGSGTGAATGNLTYLDAGTVSITGPSGSSLTNQALNKTSSGYSLLNTEGFSLPGQVSFSLPAGSYSLSGAGGNDVGAFNAAISIGSPLTVTGGLPSSVTRSAGLTLNWTGGNPSDLVEIVGSSSSTSGTGTSAVTSSTTFICLTTARQQTFTVPASILTQLPATSGSNAGFLEVASGVTAPFTAPLKAGGSIDAGVFSSFVGTGNTTSYQ